MRLKGPNGKKTKSKRTKHGGLRRIRKGKGMQWKLNELDLKKSKGNRKNKGGKMS